MTSIQLNATISSRYLRKGISHRRHFDVAAMTMIFQKNIKFFTILILRRHDIDKLNATISSRYLRKGISRRRHHFELEYDTTISLIKFYDLFTILNKTFYIYLRALYNLFKYT